MSKKLSSEEIDSRLEKFSHWELKDDQLYRKMVFEDFISAFTFMTRIAIHAEKNNHHPYWINVYNTLEIYLSTHDAGGISEKDFELAKIIDHQ